MKVALFSTKPYDRAFFLAANAQVGGHDLVFFEPRLTAETCPLSSGFQAVCPFVNDVLDSHVLLPLSKLGVRLIALRCAGFNNVDLEMAEHLGLTVTRVAAYSPHAVAEHTLALVLALDRKIHKAYNRVREGNFALEGLLGMELNGRTAGVVGTGKIGAIVARIFLGFGCKVLAHDVYPNADLTAAGVTYVPRDELFRQADIITLHCPLQPETFHIINEDSLAMMKRGVTLVNTSRGPLLDARAATRALKSGKLGALGLDVYEEEGDLFFEDLSNRVIQDDVFSRMLTFPNVLITGHQAFFTQRALEAIAQETLANITAFENGQPPPGRITAEMVRK